MADIEDNDERPESGQPTTNIIKPISVAARDEEMRRALGIWKHQLTIMLDDKFGKDQVGMAIILCPIGSHHSSINWISSLNVASLRAALEQLSNHLAQKDDAQLRVKKEYFGG